MPRIRTVKPEFFDDEKLSQVSRDARLTFIGMLIYSDDYGVVKGNSRWLKSRIFPYDDVPLPTFESWLAELANIGIIIPFVAKDETYLYIRNFKKHQVIDRPSKNRNPEPPEHILAEDTSTHQRSLVEDSTNNRRALADGKGEGKGKGVRNGKGVHPSGCVAGPASPSGDAAAPRQENAENLGSGKCGVDAEPNAVVEAEPPPENPGQDSQPGEKIAKPPAPKCGPTAVASLWNELGCRPTVQKLSETRRRKLAARLRERADPGWWKEFFTKVRDLQARGRKWITFDWLLSENNMLKVLEGNYDEDFATNGPKRAIAGNHQQRAKGDCYYAIRAVQPTGQPAAG